MSRSALHVHYRHRATWRRLKATSSTKGSQLLWLAPTVYAGRYGQTCQTLLYLYFRSTGVGIAGFAA